jgi:hypothetical protein
MDDPIRWLIETIEDGKAHFITFERTETGFDMRRFTRNIVEEQAAEIRSLRAQVKELTDELAYHGVYPTPIKG